MNYFQQFIIEVRTLEVKCIEGNLDLAHYSQFESDYSNKLAKLQQLSINEVLNLETSQIRRQLNYIDGILERFSNFWTKFSELPKDPLFTDLENLLNATFIINYNLSGKISNNFILDLHDALMFKNGYLQGFKNQIINVIGDSSANDNLQSRLTIREIALKCVYEGIQITRKNADQVIQEYGHKSGEKLYNEFTFYSKRVNRKGKPDPPTKTKFQNKIRLLKRVIDHLPENKRSMAIDELSILEKIFNSEFQ